jgi:hypothetical protein
MPTLTKATSRFIPKLDKDFSNKRGKKKNEENEILRWLYMGIPLLPNHWWKRMSSRNPKWVWRHVRTLCTFQKNLWLPYV